MKADSRAGAAESDKLDDPGAKRFLEAARKAGAEETEKGADRDFRKAVKPRIAEMKAPLNPYEERRNSRRRVPVYTNGPRVVDRTGTAPVSPHFSRSTLHIAT
jgi:hypothetical protein